MLGAESGIAGASTIVTVNGNNDIYYAGQPEPSDGQLGTTPTAIINLSDNDFVTFSRITGSVSINDLANFNDPDGVGAEGTTSSFETGANGISGITAPNGGYLVGVFLDRNNPYRDGSQVAWILRPVAPVRHLLR